MEDYTCDCDFIKNQKNYYLVLVVNLHYWQKILLKLYDDKFCLNCSWNFQSDEILKNHDMGLCKIM